MNADFQALAQRFLGTLGPRKVPDLGPLENLLTAQEIEAIKGCLTKRTYREYAGLAGISVPHRAKRLAPLAQLQQLIGLGEGSVSEQVREAVMQEMGRRGWVWLSERGDLRQTPLAKQTGVSNSQVSRFLHGGEDGVVKTSTLDRISQVVPLEVITWGERGRVYGTLAPLKPGLRREVHRDDMIKEDHDGRTEEESAQDGTVTQQIRHALGGVMGRRGWTQKEIACWTGVSQSQICRFLRGGELKTVALDRLGAFLWVEIVQRSTVSQTR